MRLSLLALSCLLLLAAPARAEGMFGAVYFTLDNGLRVVVIPNRRAPVVTHSVWYGFGGADEKPGESGVAHFLEHLMFKGTPKVPDGRFSAMVSRMGGNDNAFTTRDYTAYYQNVPADRLGAVMEMEADRMKNLTLEQDEVASERDVVVEERRQRVDNQPRAMFQEQMTAALFVNHPYATPVIGWMHEIQGLTQDMALSYYRAWYAPNNALVVVAGDVDPGEMKRLAKKHYGPLRPVKLPPRVRPRPAPLTVQHRLSLRDARVGQPVLTKAWRAPRGSDALDALTEIFGGSTTARLYRELVVEEKTAVAAGMDYDPVSRDDTALTVYASPAPGVTMQQLETALDAKIAALLENGVTEDELAGARTRRKANFTWYRDSLQGPAMLFGRVLSSGFDASYLENWTARVDALTVADVNAALRKTLGGRAFPVTGLLMPQAAEGEKRP